jgi:hypothetical protein
MLTNSYNLIVRNLFSSCRAYTLSDFSGLNNNITIHNIHNIYNRQNNNNNKK